MCPLVELKPASSRLAPFSLSPRAILPLKSLEMHHGALEQAVAGDNVAFRCWRLEKQSNRSCSDLLLAGTIFNFSHFGSECIIIV
jgi:hypothetical protein